MNHETSTTINQKYYWNQVTFVAHIVFINTCAQAHLQTVAVNQLSLISSASQHELHFTFVVLHRRDLSCGH